MVNRDQLTNDLASLKIDRDARRERRIPRAIIYIGVLAGLAALGYFFGYPYLAGKIYKTEVEVTAVRMESPASGSMKLTATGYVIARRQAKVAAKVSGRIAKIFIEENQAVPAGMVIAELEDADSQSQLAAARARAQAARARTQTARANLAETQVSLARERQLVERGVSGKATVEDLEARERSLEQAVAAAAAEALAADAESKTLSVSLDNTKITAPIAGVIVDKLAEVGELVGPGSGPVVELVDFDSIVVEVDVPEARLGEIVDQMPCHIVLDSAAGEKFDGAVFEIGKRINRAKASAAVRVKFNQIPPGVKVDAAARVSFLDPAAGQVVKGKDRLVVPKGAVVDRGGAKVVFVVRDGQVRMTTVSIGAEEMGGAWVLLDGQPAEGTKIVNHPPAALADGQKIKEKGRK